MPASDLTPNHRVVLAAIAGPGWCGKRLNAITTDRVWWVGMAHFSEKTARVLVRLRLIRKGGPILTARGAVYALRYDITPKGRELLAPAAE